jgi:hypothetical protein
MTYVELELESTLARVKRKHSVSVAYCRIFLTGV